MPRFQIQEQRTTLQGPRAQPISFGSGQGLKQLGAAVGQAGSQLEAYAEKKGRDIAAVHKARLKTEAANQLTQSIEEAGDDQIKIDALSDDFDKKFNQLKSKTLSDVPAIVRGQMSDDLEIMRENFRLKSRSASAEASARVTMANAEEIIELSANRLLDDPEDLKGALDDVMEYVDNQDRLPADQRKRVVEFARSSLAKASIRGLGPEDALDNLRDGAYDNFLSPDTKASMIAAKERELIGLKAEEKKALEAVNAGRLSDLEINVKRGQSSYSDIEDAYDNGKGWLKPRDRTRLTLALDEALKENIKEANNIERVNLALEHGINLDPKSRDDRKAMNDHYKNAVAQWGTQVSPQELLVRSVDYSAKIGMVPDPIKAVIRGNIRAGTDDQRVLAAGMIQRMRNSNHELLNEFDQQDISLGNLIATYTGYGAQPNDAVRLSIEAMEVPETTRDARKEEYKAHEEENPARAWLANKLDEGFFSSEPNVPVAMAEEFNELARVEFERHGNIDAARTSAVDRVLRSWGESGMNGEKNMMRMAPEKFYGVSGLDRSDNTEWMLEQLYDDIRGDSFGDIEDLEENVFITHLPNVTTPEGLPLYQINIINVDGIVRPHRNSNGEIIPWAPDWSTSKLKQKQDAEVREEVEEAKKARDRFLMEVE